MSPLWNNLMDSQKSKHKATTEPNFLQYKWKSHLHTKKVYMDVHNNQCLSWMDIYVGYDIYIE